MARRIKGGRSLSCMLISLNEPITIGSPLKNDFTTMWCTYIPALGSGVLLFPCDEIDRLEFPRLTEGFSDIVVRMCKDVHRFSPSFVNDFDFESILNSNLIFQNFQFTVSHGPRAEAAVQYRESCFQRVSTFNSEIWPQQPGVPFKCFQLLRNGVEDAHSSPRFRGESVQRWCCRVASVTIIWDHLSCFAFWHASGRIWDGSRRPIRIFVNAHVHVVWQSSRGQTFKGVVYFEFFLCYSILLNNYWTDELCQFLWQQGVTSSVFWEPNNVWPDPIFVPKVAIA